MATHTVHTDSTGKYITVVSGDTLSQIAADHKADTGNKTYQQLAALNGIANADLIYVGQKIYLTKDGGGGSSSTSSSSANSNKPTIDHFGEKANDSGKLFATWTWSKHSTTQHYEVWWEYYTEDKVWFVDRKQNVENRQDIYPIPEGATKVRFYVKPVAKTKKDGDKEVAQWTAEWSTEKKWSNDKPLKEPPAPTVSIDETDKTKLIARLDNIDIDRAKYIYFELVRDDKSIVDDSSVAITTGSAKAEFTMASNHTYKVRCYAYEKKQAGYWSDWGPYSSSVGSGPANTAAIKTIRAESKDSVYLDWNAVAGATSYQIQRAENQQHFVGSSTPPQQYECDSTSFLCEDISFDPEKNSTGEQFFRIRAVNSGGESDWSAVKSIRLGTKPNAPTTWSSAMNVVEGDVVTLYWTHNSEDGSKEQSARICIQVNGGNYEYDVITKTGDEDISIYKLPTASYSDGATIYWWIQTAGAWVNPNSNGTNYGEWSVRRKIVVSEKPTMDIVLKNNSDASITGGKLKQFPLNIHMTSSGGTPIGYHVSVVSRETYDTVDNLGNSTVVHAGETIYSKYFETSSKTPIVVLDASNINLENNAEYDIIGIVSMTSGLTAQDTASFSVEWDEVAYAPNAKITIDKNALTATIMPYCEDSRMVNYKVDYSNRKYVKSSNEIGFIYGDTKIDALTTTGEQVYQGTTVDGITVYYCEDIVSAPVTDVTLSVYRREFDGGFTEIETGLSGQNNTEVVDPHPALDFARYRIIATHNGTGAITYHDIQGYAVGGKAVIIQWDENWTSFESTDGATLAEPEWSGSMLKLPYNIDISDTTSPEVSMVEYIGRANPVSYYGTQKRQTATWSVEIEKDDKDTLYGLRRLANWMGDVYVREPSGSGYWANVTVSFDVNHVDKTIPVTFTITRVEGGI